MNSRSKKKSRDLEISSYSHVNDTIKIIYGSEDAVTKGVEFMNNVKKKMDLCYDSKAPSIVLDVSSYKNGYIDIRKRGGKIRVITEITKENLEYCKRLLNIVDEMRHLDNVKGGIAINEKEYMATNILHESKPLTQVVYSNVRDVVDQQQNFFNSLWNSAIPAKQRIREIINELAQRKIDIFSALDNNIRRLMISYLQETNMTMSQLAKKLNITLQAMQKHFTKLIDAEIIKKNPDGIVSLTNLGKILMLHITPIQFVANNSEYLKTHDMFLLPKQFVQRIDDLQDMEITLKKEKEKIDNSFFEEAEYIKIITVQNCFKIKKSEFPKLVRKKVKIFHIEETDTQIPKLRGIELQKKDSIKYNYEKKITKDLPLALAVSNKEAYLTFKKNKSIDVQKIIFSRDSKFISWCNDFFDHAWNSKNTP